MKLNVSKEQAELRRLALHELRVRYAKVFGEPPASGNRSWLVKRILWRLQALAEGGLSERARRRAAELVNEADLRLSPPASPSTTVAPADPGNLPVAKQAVPIPGTVITRVYKGEPLHVKVLADGFEFKGKTYASLSAVAKAITGTHTSGRLFFRLSGKDGDR